jgi:hypothetical protein
MKRLYIKAKMWIKIKIIPSYYLYKDYLKDKANLM